VNAGVKKRLLSCEMPKVYQCTFCSKVIVGGFGDSVAHTKVCKIDEMAGVLHQSVSILVSGSENTRAPSS
jgi:hypothetical protein